MEPAKKWRLQSGRFVEEILYSYAVDLQREKEKLVGLAGSNIMPKFATCGTSASGSTTYEGIRMQLSLRGRDCISSAHLNLSKLKGRRIPLGAAYVSIRADISCPSWSASRTLFLEVKHFSFCSPNSKSCSPNIKPQNNPKTGIGVAAKRSERPLKLSERDQRAAVRNFREQPFVSFVERAAKLKDAGINIHPQTLSIYARRNGFGSYTPASLPTLKPAQFKKRRAWAQEKVSWTPEQWKSVIWSDKSKFNVNGSDGRIRVFRKEGERLSPDHVHKIVKFGNVSILIWGCFWAGGLGPILPWLQNLSFEHSKGFIFQEDGASCHTGKPTYLERRIETRRHQLKNVDQLETCLRNECQHSRFVVSFAAVRKNYKSLMPIKEEFKIAPQFWKGADYHVRKPPIYGPETRQTKKLAIA
ncbi:hypothetical protein [Parasitella parasitica]|uniref:Transposase Tc1-like domain-containing protein n=1 Tax=Parasitella parasitica TaxID=35722 RepID=A0A0B7MVG4_9FUNG|nr:hypothetical protein [Parasitella parasitica]